ncbi:MAG: hypothetical protein IJW70_04670 [Clostridia bacterium]|nr:hypothetical protein [Clostridia bacterium]
MKKKVLLSSIVTIAVCLCLIAGSTFALFTDREEVSIVVSSANVDLVANVGELTLYSAKADVNGNLKDENGNKYVHEQQDGLSFSNGGTASYDVDKMELSIERITPGDKIEIPISATNNSDVAIQYRYVVKCTDEATAQLLTRGKNSMFFTVSSYPIIIKGQSFTSDWETLQPGQDMEEVIVTLELPVAAGNEYQNLEANFVIIIEAVQANGVVDGTVDTDDDSIIEGGVWVGDGD